MFRPRPFLRTIHKPGLPAWNELAPVLLGVTLMILLVGGCTPTPTSGPSEINIEIVDGTTSQTVTAAIGSSVQSVLESAGISLNPMDRTDPQSFTLITAPLTIKITRVTEEYEVEEVVIPFEHQTVRNESLPEGEELLIQPGENGLQHITYRRVLENGVQMSRSVFKVTNIVDARPEIVMVGVQAPFKPIDITGRLAYLTAGNAWIMVTSTAERKPILTTGDLDGRVFTLSPDGNWLLFTRTATDTPNNINTLWAVYLNSASENPIDLKVSNIIHYAGWDPAGGLVIYYSTVEPRSTAPGWQANNDLRWLSFSAGGVVEKTDTIIETNTGGIYGWWGTQYVWSHDGSKLAYARPDSVGLVDFGTEQTRALFNLIPFQTGSDWSWSPGITWSNDGQLLYAVTHAALTGLPNEEASPVFNFSAFMLENGPLIDLVTQVGMFAYPVVSPAYQGNQTSIALLQAIFPEQSENSRYRLVLIDQDGSNLRTLYPPEGSAGIDPQQVVWEPNNAESVNHWLAFINQGNIWLIDSTTGQIQQITGDGLISRIDWK